MAELNFDTSDLPGIVLGTRVRLDGTIDVSTSDAFRATLLTLLSMGRRRFLLDFSGVDYVHSAGFACMVELSQHLRETGGIAVISGMQPAVEEIVLSLGLDAFFGVSDKEDKAMALLKWSAPEAAPPTLDEMDGEDSVGFYIGPGDSDGELTAVAEEAFDPADALIADAVPDDEYSSETFRMSAVEDAAGVISTDGTDGWTDSNSTPDESFTAPGDSDEAVAVALGADDGAHAEPAEGEDAEAFEEADVLITSNDMLAPPPPPPHMMNDPHPVVEASGSHLFPIGWPAGTPASASSADAIAIPSESHEETDALPVATMQADPRAVAQHDAVPVAPAALPRAARPKTSTLPGAASVSTADLDAELAAEPDLRVKRLKATARLLQWIPEADRLWRKMLVYLSRDPVTQVATLNLVVARVNRNRGKDAFPVAAANPYVMVRPRIPGGICIPEMVAVDVTSGGDEVTFRIERDKNPSRPDAPTGKPCLEIWYGPSVIRTVPTANPFD
ncbi:MAG: STAS domain-containing protein [Planctomycetota bacterium]